MLIKRESLWSEWGNSPEFVFSDHYQSFLKDVLVPKALCSKLVKVDSGAKPLYVSFTGLLCLSPLGSWMSENKQTQPFAQEGQGPQLHSTTAAFIHHENSQWARILQRNQIRAPLVEQLRLAEKQRSSLGNGTMIGVIKLEMQRNTLICF